MFWNYRRETKAPREAWGFPPTLPGAGSTHCLLTLEKATLYLFIFHYPQQEEDFVELYFLYLALGKQ